MSNDKSLIVFSGGQDSTTSLYMAQQESDVQALVFFNYGQKHGPSEWQAVQGIAAQERIKLYQIDLISLSKLGRSNLIQGSGSVNESHPVDASLPSSFVPGRNLLMITMAAAMAYNLGYGQVWTGVNAVDYSGYPDCRPETIDSLNETINLGFGLTEDAAIKIVTPLIAMSKSEIWNEAAKLGKLKSIRQTTHTCYNGDHSTRHVWGFGCGTCPACTVRAEGWVNFVKEYPDMIPTDLGTEF